ncbi:MAG TPA: DUF4091 domain-containing protein [Myxococcaceae bacterium]|nr:DUF4091 domain-containing protein [Myxococcaceae bacterium]
MTAGLLGGAAAVLLTLGAARVPAQNQAPGPLSWARVVPALQKVRPGDAPRGAPAADLSLARGECEAFQIFAAPGAQKVDVAEEQLKGPGKPLRPRIYREEFVEVRTPSNTMGAKGLWPDPLIPVVDAYAGEKRNALPHDSTQDRPLVLYVELCAPATQAPGLYSGALIVSASNRPRARIPVAARVNAFQLPATSSLPNSFGISIYSLAKGHGVPPESEEGRALLRRYATAALAHRISLHGMGIDPVPARFHEGKAELDFTGYDREMAPFLEGTALPSGARFTTAEVRMDPRLKSEEERRAYLRAFRQHFDAKGWTAQLFFYAKDEPKPEDRPLVLQQSRDARAVGRLPVLVTSPLDPELTPAADIVAPTLNCFFERPGPATCPRVATIEALRKAAGPFRKIWWYQACPSHGCDSGPFGDPAVDRVYSGWPSYIVDHPATLNRAMGVLGWLQGIDGELYFATVYAYDFRDPWTGGVWDFGGNGDGTLFYPGTPAHIGGKTHIPIESLRLKHLRDGLEDYEYLHLLAALGDREFARSKARSLAPKGYEIEPRPAKWEEVRRQITVRLNALWKNSEFARRSPVGR